jgi:uncharacterized caspase-like protein
MTVGRPIQTHGTFTQTAGEPNGQDHLTCSIRQSCQPDVRTVKGDCALRHTNCRSRVSLLYYVYHQAARTPHAAAMELGTGSGQQRDSPRPINDANASPVKGRLI